jgi:hypothetical protein
MSSVVISGNTSGTITLDAPAVAGTTTLTLPATSGTVALTASPTFTGQATIPTINLTGGQITFPATQSPSANANTLDDYEEGTWTPAYAGSGGGTQGSGTSTGNYTKIGNIVICYGIISFAKSTLSGNITLTGLPFTLNSTAGSGSASVNNVYRWATNMSNFSISPVDNTTTCSIYKNATNADPETSVTATDMVDTAFRNVFSFIIIYEVA